jgi:ferredoxin-type protein NapG
MRRREFFRFGAHKAAKFVSQAALEKFPSLSPSWIRPPFALPEIAFEQACTRCDACIEACDYGVLFRLTEVHGRREVETPAMDLLNKGCRMCADWPCVTVCEPRALVIPDEEAAPPKLARVRVDPEICLPYAGPECGACAHACPVPGALEWRDGTKPVVNQQLCTGCALCREACIVEPKAVNVVPAAPEESAANVS